MSGGIFEALKQVLFGAASLRDKLQTLYEGLFNMTFGEILIHAVIVRLLRKVLGSEKEKRLEVQPIHGLNA